VKAVRYAAGKMLEGRKKVQFGPLPVTSPLALAQEDFMPTIEQGTPYSLVPAGRRVTGAHPYGTTKTPALCLAHNLTEGTNQPCP
jgi:hypothetical protein